MKGEIIICKIGDIIVVKEFKDENDDIVSKHSFVVINDKPNSIHGLNYDIVSNMMRSFHDPGHKENKLKFRQNLLVNIGDTYGKKN